MKSILPLLLLAALGGCVAQGGAHNSMPFGDWLSGFEQEAKMQGISDQTLSDAFHDTKPIGRIIELDRKQPESVMTLTKYLTNTVSKSRIENGRTQLVDNHELLEKVSADYGVQANFIVALWGIESNFGGNTGGFRTVDALATLAYDGRRADFFRNELLKTLHILQDEHMGADEMQGSWAGALGQCQFMPSTYLTYAVDYDNDGKRDIWGTQADVFASIANYLKSLGWNKNQGWGFAVTLPADFDTSLADIKQEKSWGEWQALGVKAQAGAATVDSGDSLSLILVGEGDDAAPYVVTGNYKALLKWNHSRFFATAVGTLADSIGK